MKPLIAGALLACLMYQGCSTAPVDPVIHTETVEVDRPVAVPCVTALPAHDPFMTDAQIKSGSAGQVVTKLRLDRIARAGYEAQLEAALTACVASGKTAP